MADLKISELASASSAAGADLLNIVQGGTNKKLTVANFLANINTQTVFNSVADDIDTRISGDADPYLILADASANRVGIGVQTPSEKLEVAGNLAVSGGFLRLNQTPQSLVGSGTLIANVTNSITNVTTVGSASLSLVDGVQGQIKTIIMTAYGGDATLAPNSRGGYSTITFNSTGDSVTLLFNLGVWYIIGQNGVIVA